MTHGQFLIAIEEWYGQYTSDLKRDTVLAWLNENVKELVLESLFKRVTADYSEQYKTPPTQFNFNQIINGDRIEVMAERAFDKLRGMSAMESYIIEDVKIQQVVDSMGGIIKFVDRKDGDDAVWVRKEFVQKYMEECRYPREIERRVMLGYRDKSNMYATSGAGVGYYGYKYIGNDKNREQIMQSVKGLNVGHSMIGLVEDMMSRMKVDNILQKVEAE